MINYNILDKVLDKIKEITGIEKFDDTKILIDTDDKLSGDITLENIVILTICAINNDNKFYLQLFSEEQLYDQ